MKLRWKRNMKRVQDDASGVDLRGLSFDVTI